MVRIFSDLEYPLGALEAGYRRQHLQQDIRQSILVGGVWLLPNFLLLFLDYLMYATQPIFISLVWSRLFFGCDCCHRPDFVTNQIARHL